MPKNADLFFYYDSDRGKIGHVAIYEGPDDFQVINASGEKYGIKESSADYKEITAIRRFI